MIFVSRGLFVCLFICCFGILLFYVGVFVSVFEISGKYLIQSSHRLFVCLVVFLLCLFVCLYCLFVSVFGTSGKNLIQSSHRLFVCLFVLLCLFVCLSTSVVCLKLVGST